MCKKKIKIFYFFQICLAKVKDFADLFRFISYIILINYYRYVPTSYHIIHGGVITPGISPIRYYGGVIYYTNIDPDSLCRNELHHRNAVMP